jgi:DNA repair ATPase RecN
MLGVRNTMSVAHAKTSIGLLVLVGLLLSACSKDEDPLPKFIEKFRTQVVKFDDDRTDATKTVKEGLASLDLVEQAVEKEKAVNKNVGKAFKQWKKVDGEVDDLRKGFKKLTKRAEQLLAAIGNEIKQLDKGPMRDQREKDFAKLGKDYAGVLSTTKKAIDKMNEVHHKALQILKNLRIGMAMAGMRQEMKTGFTDIRKSISLVMIDLQKAIDESNNLLKRYSS